MMADNKNDNQTCCPRCKSTTIIKYGTRNNHQLYRCKQCNKRFQNTPLRHTHYPPAPIISALTYYNQGHSLDNTSTLVNKQFKIKTSKSTIHHWLKKYHWFAPYLTIRPPSKKTGQLNPVVCSYAFTHGQLTYRFAYHSIKTKKYCTHFLQPVQHFLLSMNEQCPHEWFSKDERCSQQRISSPAMVIHKKNSRLSSLARFALQTSKHNRDRHDIVEHYLLYNDRYTIACEIPIWFWDKQNNQGICGHIDLLQIRKGNLYVLDFKPQAEKQHTKTMSQLLFYAKGLSYRTKIPLSNIICGWFDDQQYYEFHPTI